MNRARPLGLVLWIVLGFSAALAAGDEADSGKLVWHSSYESALEEAEETGKPLFLEFRCAPCTNGREFDAKVYYTDPNSPRGKLMSRYVLARITTMTGVDISHFDRDWHNSLYYFVINANEDIYLRYGGRDEIAADSYLDFDSLELALEIGLKEHEAYQQGRRPSPARPEPVHPEDFPLIRKNVIEANRCTECHLIGDYTLQEKARAGLLDPIRDLYRSPDIKKIGLILDVPKGLLLAKTHGPAAEAGIRSGDTIISLNGQRVLTFGDLQYLYDKVPRHETSVEIGVLRDGKNSKFVIHLPFEWWKTSLDFRHWTMEPRLNFEASPLGTKEKLELGLPENGFASRVESVDLEAVLSSLHSLEIGDIIVAVNDATRSAHTRDVATYIRLKHAGSEKLTLGVLRDGELQQLPLITGRVNFRKVADDAADNSLDLVWSEPAPVTKGTENLMSYRAAVANGYLLVRANHQPGWHSFAIDNPVRGMRKAGGKLNQEQPTVIKITRGPKPKGRWLQTEPADYSKPDLHWFTWGFEGTSYFAVKLAETPDSPMEVRISSQVCDGEVCAGTSGLKLEVPPPNNEQTNLSAALILQGLTPVLEPDAN